MALITNPVMIIAVMALTMTEPLLNTIKRKLNMRALLTKYLVFRTMDFRLSGTCTLILLFGFLFYPDTPIMAQKSGLSLKANQPGKEQQRLEKFVGSYMATSSYWEAPDQPPVVTSMLSEQKMIMGGRFLQVEDQTEDGSLKWRAVHGYEAAKGYYQSIGHSNQSNEVSMARSFIDDDGNWLVFGVNGQGQPFKGVGKLTSDGYTYTNYLTSPDGKETKYREIVYRRKSGE